MSSSPQRDIKTEIVTDSKVNESQILRTKQPTHLKLGFCSLPVLAIKIVVGFIVIWVALYGILSETLLRILAVPEDFIVVLQLIKPFLLLIIMIPTLYLFIVKQTGRLEKSLAQVELWKLQIDRMNVLYHMSHKVNQVILRLTDKQQIILEICEIIAQCGEFELVWIGLGQTEEKIPETLISSGKNQSYVNQLMAQAQNANAQERSEPGLAVLRKKHSIIINDIEGYSKKQYAWQSRALIQGFNSIAAFPLKTSSDAHGVLCLYATHLNEFDQEVEDFLRELAADISHGISSIEQKEHLYFAANYDVTTKLPNMKLLEDRLAQAAKRSIRNKNNLAIIVIKVQKLSTIAEQYGQAVCDELLLELGKHLKNLTRDGDTVARIGFDELAIMTPDIADPFDVAMVANKLAKPLGLRVGQQLELTVNFLAGVAILPKDTNEYLDLVHYARTALQRLSSDDTILCAFYSKEIGSGVKYTEQIKEGLVQSVKNNEFLLFYQPIIDLETQYIIAVEALVRWQNPKLGEVSPVQFIPLANEIGVLDEIENWVIKNALLQLQEWHQIGFENIQLNINLSGKRFLNSFSIEWLSELLKQLKVDPHRFKIALEITEEIFIDEPKQLYEVFSKLKEMGVEIWLDDFGTGYASLNYIYNLPINGLKIDSMYIRTLAKDKNAQAMLQGIMAIAKGLNVPVVAEGVETMQQIKILRELGCHTVQGYYFSPPVLPQKIKELFNKKMEL